MTDDPRSTIEHAEWERRPITLICGPPGSGKTTLGIKIHGRTLDIDDMPAGTPRERMRRYGRSAYNAGRMTSPNLAVIRGAPKLSDRQHIEKLCHPATTIILLTDAATCHQRIDARNRSGTDGRDIAGQHAAADAWWVAWAQEQTASVDGPSGYRWP
jgi:hypothetical protein|tara:strand:+ start:2103 stop:2573 length:471 start_codon:yes stop_codon:yes gene_type:complete